MKKSVILPCSTLELITRPFSPAKGGESDMGAGWGLVEQTLCLQTNFDKYKHCRALIHTLTYRQCVKKIVIYTTNTYIYSASKKFWHRHIHIYVSITSLIFCNSNYESNYFLNVIRY